MTDPFNETASLERYPKVPDYSRLHGGLACLAFEKHDGTNLLWRFRAGRLARGMPVLRSGRVMKEARPLLEQQLDLPRLLPSIEGDEVVLVTEYRGERSFSGEHVAEDPKRLHAIDVWVKGRGFMPPGEFAKIFGVSVVYRGKLTAKFAEDVRRGHLGVNEGVVCKGGDWGSVWCCKIKTRAWLARGGEA